MVYEEDSTSGTLDAQTDQAGADVQAQKMKREWGKVTADCRAETFFSHPPGRAMFFGLLENR